MVKIDPVATDPSPISFETHKPGGEIGNNLRGVGLEKRGKHAYLYRPALPIRFVSIQKDEESAFSIEKARDLLGWEPKHDWRTADEEVSVSLTAD